MPCYEIDGLRAGGRPDRLRAPERGADRRRDRRPALLRRPAGQPARRLRPHHPRAKAATCRTPA
ncbi:MAG: hypothetical protein MZV49_09425 [Rhodopseudomonas palustris]|nr:hypothetical protein [Rhodopseudomonas palustris]